MAEPIPIPQGPNALLNLPRATPSNAGRELEYAGNVIAQAGYARKELEDQIEGNRLLSEHAIAADKLQSDLLKTSVDDGFGGTRSLRDDELVPLYTQKLEQLNQEIVGKARSPEVKAFLEGHLPQRGAAKTIEMQAHSNARFVSNFLSELDTSEVRDQTAYALANTQAGKDDAKKRHLNLIAAAESRGALTAEQATKRREKFLQEIELYDVARTIQLAPEAGIKAITDPEAFLKQFPNTPVDKLDTIFAQSVQVQERQRRELERIKKENQDAIAPTVYEAAIRGQLDWNTLNKAKNFLSKEDYVSLGKLVQSNYQAGGVDDPSVKADLEFRLRARPGSVTPADVGRAYSNGQLSLPTAQQIMDKAHQYSEDAKNDAERTDPRLKGPEWSEAKSKIDQIVGKGITTMGVTVEDPVRRRWAAAADELLERAKTDRSKPLMDIANDIIKKYEGPAEPVQIAPQKYRNDKLPDKIDAKKLRDDYSREKDPTKKKKLLDLMRQMNEFQSSQNQ